MKKEENIANNITLGILPEPPKKQIVRIQVPFTLRFALIWTVFFIIVGIIIESIKSGYFIFTEFFASNYADWFRSFGSFVQTTEYDSAMSVFKSIMAHWYYFFYTGGLLSLIWGLISWLIHAEIVVKKSENMMPQIIAPKIVSIREQEAIQEQKEKIEEWLEEGLRLLAEGNLEEAELIYRSIKQEYDPLKDIERKSYKRILDFYSEIVSEREIFNKKR